MFKKVKVGVSLSAFCDEASEASSLDVCVRDRVRVSKRQCVRVKKRVCERERGDEYVCESE